MNTTKNTWIRRVAAGALLAAAPALLALGTAGVSNAKADPANPGYSYSPPAEAPSTSGYPWHGNLPWDESSFHHRHAAEQQAMY
jgi:hypothetical protein